EPRRRNGARDDDAAADAGAAAGEVAVAGRREQEQHGEDEQRLDSGEAGDEAHAAAIEAGAGEQQAAAHPAAAADAPAATADSAPKARVAEDAQPADLDLDPAAPLEPHLRVARDAHARRRAGIDQVARQQRHHLRDVADQVLDAEDHLFGVAVLHRLAV